jgi:hypothetical protein
MTTNTFHPATFQLLSLQSRGRRRRIWRRFRQPRRLLLSAVACVLAIAWLGNAAITVWLRESASPETLRALLSIGLAVYAVWHLAKAAFFRPESPFDWTPAERDLLAPMPLLPRDLVAYQLASVTVTTILKAGLFTLLLLPDLRCLPLGLIGLLLAMLMLEMLRMAVEIATWGMSRLAYLAYRALVVTGLVAGGVAIGVVIVRENAFERINVGDGLLDRMLEILVQVNGSVFGYVALPFRPFVDLILANSVSAANIGLVVAASAIVGGCGAAVVGLYSVMARRVARRERRGYGAGRRGAALVARGLLSERQTGMSAPRLMRIPHWGGAGALAWRQLVGARRHWGSLLTAMIAPAFAACAPCFVIADPQIALLVTAATVAFYTFLLLPTAIRFDFRRDLDRLAILKGLPIKPSAAVIGQVLAPVLIATLFQSVVLAIAIVARSLPAHQLIIAMLIMVPFNVLVFGFDNLIYLLYPYRMQQEGLEIFFRTMLTFTGKGLLFALGLAATAAWGFTAAALSHGISDWTGSNVNSYAVLTVGMIAGPSLLAALVLHGLSRTYRNMDPIEDMPR